MINLLSKTFVLVFILNVCFGIKQSLSNEIGISFQKVHSPRKTHRKKRKKTEASLATDNQLKPTVYCWGDSFTSDDYPVTFAQFTGYHMIDKGIGGQTSTQIKQRMLADTASHKFASIIWAGRNNYKDTATVIADVKDMVNALKSVGNNKYLVIGVVNGNYSREFIGGDWYNIIIDLNNKLAKIYGKHFINIRPVLVSLYNPTLKQDVIDHDHDVPPTSKRIDLLHPTLTADTAIAHYFMKSIDLLNK